MMFKHYYGDQFRRDLSEVLTYAPSTHHPDADEVTIQPRTLSSENVAIRRWDELRRGLFASGLFLAVLADQVCYTYYRDQYAAFRELTRYPKFRGDCPGGCYHHINPAGVFSAIGKPPAAWPRDDRIDYASLPPDLFEVMRSEVAGFFPVHLPAIDADGFWARCDASIPLDFRLHYMSSRKRRQ